VAALVRTSLSQVSTGESEESLDDFRQEVRAWLTANLPAGWSDDPFSVDPAARAALLDSWNQRLADGNWLCPTWPTAYGARGLSPEAATAMREEFWRAKAPLRPDNLGEVLVGPTLLAWADDEQKQRFLPPIVRGEEIWCQGFSEPDAGSDLAGLRTRAEVGDDGLHITGQKIWTSMAHEADYIFMLARTDPDAPRHKGISFLLVPMRQPGIEFRPIIRLDGAGEFSEVFFDNAFCPMENVVGGLHNGWQVAVAGLGFERGTSATTSSYRFQNELDSVIDLARSTGRSADPLVRQELARAYAKVAIIRYNEQALQRDGTHRNIDALAAITKVLWSEYHQRVTDLQINLMGPAGQILQGAQSEQDHEVLQVTGVGLGMSSERYPVSTRQSAFFFSRSETIWGGTSEVQRNIIAERVLGLPREPSANRS
jgi:alkylation response protein AidB-like acyl-CoA dehydrogenase